MKKAVKIVASILAALVLICAVGIFAMWHNEISSVMSFKQVRVRNDDHLDASVYDLHVKGDFYLDKFVKQGGVSDDGELIDFVVQNITKGLIPVSIKKPEIGCSSFTAAAENGDRLFARNYDMRKTNTCIVHTDASKGRHASISTVDLGLIGMNADADVEGIMKKITCLAAAYAPLDGMNDAGVSCGVYMSYQGGDDDVVETNQNTEKPDFTTTTFLRMVLDYADDLDEAVEIAQAYDMHDSAGTSYHYMVADASGRSAVFEWVNGTDATDLDGSARELIITYNDDDANIGENEGKRDFQWVTNFIIQPDYYDNEEDMKGLDRYDHIYDVLSQTDGVVTDEKAAMDLLRQVGRRTWDSNGVTITVHSAIYNLTEKTVYWVPNENFDDPDAWFSFKL